MPKINGFELYDELKSRDSNIKTLFITALSSVESYNTQNSKVYPLKGQRDKDIHGETGKQKGTFGTSLFNDKLAK